MKPADVFLLASALWLIVASVYLSAGEWILGAVWCGNALLYLLLALFFKHGNVFHTHEWTLEIRYDPTLVAETCKSPRCNARRLRNPTNGKTYRTV